MHLPGILNRGGDSVYTSHCNTLAMELCAGIQCTLCWSWIIAVSYTQVGQLRFNFVLSCVLSG